MVAQVNHEVFSDARLTPPSETSDSPDVLHALETARELESRGEVRDAVRWLRRAAEAAEEQGNDMRVLALARAAADLTNTLAPVSLAPASVPPPSAPPISNEQPRERRMRIGSVRVAFAGSMQESSFAVHRLAAGQPVPDGMTEAILVLTGGVEGRVEIETTLRVADRSPNKS